VVMSGALVTAGLYPSHTATSGNRPPSRLAHSVAVQVEFDESKR
jgi:hypothetical protein